MNRIGTRLLLSGVAVGVCLAAQAAEPPAMPTSQVTFSGMKVGIDAKTGKLRPLTAEESRQLDTILTQGRRQTFAPSVSRSFQHPNDEAAARSTMRRTAGGGVSVKLPESQMSNVTLRRDAAGRAVIEHDDAAATAPAGGLPNE